MIRGIGLNGTYISKLGRWDLRNEWKACADRPLFYQLLSPKVEKRDIRSVQVMRDDSCFIGFVWPR